MKRIFNLLCQACFVICKIFLILIIAFFAISYIIKAFENKYNGPQYESDMYQMMDDYATSYGKKNNSEVVHIGNFDRKSKSIIFGIWLRCYSSEDLQAGKIRAVTFVRDFYSMLQQNNVVKFYLDETCRRYQHSNNNSIDLSSVGVKIAYWDKSVNRPQAPYLSQITFLNGNFYYYEADPTTQALSLVYQESYDDALKTLK